MLKVKHERTADVVVAGYRLHKTSTEERAAARLAAARAVRRRREPAPHRGLGVLHREPSGAAASRSCSRWCPTAPTTRGAQWQEITASGERMPGAVSRWSAGKDLSFVPLRPERVLEVGYDHMEGERFRHTAQFKRWRDDRDPQSVHLRAARGAGLLRPRRRARVPERRSTATRHLRMTERRDLRRGAARRAAAEPSRTPARSVGCTRTPQTRSATTCCCRSRTPPRGSSRRWARWPRATRWSPPR